jgi:RNA polymerase sigma factor (sigma-70 family)
MPPDSRTDEELMIQVQQGDRAAYAALFARYQRPVWAFLVRRTGDGEAASDLFQEVFLRIWRAAGTYDKSLRFKPWLYRVAANACRDRFRSGQRTVETVEVDLDRTGAVGFDDPIGAVDLERALAQLPENLREAFLLGAINGLDHNEVAAALEITPVNARARISRARAQLREILMAGTPAGEA